MKDIRMIRLATIIMLAYAGTVYSQVNYGNWSANQFAPNAVAHPQPQIGQNIQLYNSAGEFRGNLNNNQFDPNSVSNPFGRYGSQFSPESVNNQFGAGSQFNPDSPSNQFGHGLHMEGR